MNLRHNQIRLCTVRSFPILKQNFGSEICGPVSTDASDNVAACEACRKYIRLCHPEICHKTGSRKSLGGRFFFLCLEIAFKPSASRSLTSSRQSRQPRQLPLSELRRCLRLYEAILPFPPSRCVFAS